MSRKVQQGAGMNISTYNSTATIVHVIGALAAGGAERFVSDLVQDFRKSGLNVILFILSSRLDAVGNQMLDDLERAGVELYRGPTRKVGIRTVGWYTRKLFTVRPDIVHLHTPNTELAHYLATCIYRRAHKIFRTIHSVRFSNSCAMRFAIRANSASKSIACGAAVYQAHKQALSQRMVTVENGVRFHWPAKNPARTMAEKVRRGFEIQSCHFLMVGRMNGTCLQNGPKGHDVLIRAWREGKLGDKQGVLHILGDGNLRGQLTAMADGDASIIFHGVQSNVYEWLLASDCYVMPSRYEGLPIAGIEAMGTGVPCIFSDIPPLRELNAVHALWVPVENSAALSQALHRVVRKLPSVDVAEVNQFRERFDIKHTAHKYAQLYASETSCFTA